MKKENTFTIPNISITKSAANGQVYDVIDYEEYYTNKSMYLNRTDVAIKTEYNGQDIILPIKGEYKGNPISPGIYNAGPVDFFNYPEDTNINRYIPTNTITMNNKDGIGEIIKAEEASKHLDEDFIINPDNITIFPIKENDQPEMIALKSALNSKHIDLDKYSGRFGYNFPNDKRQLKSNSATLNIIKRYCENCDMEALLIIRDRDKDVPNPIGKEIKISLTNPSELETIFNNTIAVNTNEDNDKEFEITEISEF